MSGRHPHPPGPRRQRSTWGMAATIAALYLAGWGLTGWQALVHPGFLGLATVAFTLGLRHAFDADHIAAIDNTTRKLRQEGERSGTVGFFFSLGHSTSVLVLTAGLALAAHATRAALPGVRGVGGTIGTLLAGGFLWVIGLLNLAVLHDVARVALRIRRGEATTAEVGGLATSGGLMSRIGLSRLFRRIGRPWQMLPLGLVFGLGFDTASEVALLGLGAGAAASGLPFVAVMALPLLFAAGMATLDTADGVLMAHAYDWALRDPVRRIFYNLLVTALSVAVALLIGTVELLQVAADKLGLHGGLWATVQGLDFQTLGYVMVGLFVITWAGALLLWRALRVGERWAAYGGRTPMQGPLLLLTTADTEILAAAHATGLLPAGFHEVRCANPLRTPELADELLSARPAAVVCRLLGGRRAWPEGVARLRERSQAERWPLLLMGGEAEPDAELTALSTAPAATVAEAFEYLRHGGVENTANLLRFLADTLLLEGHGFEPPRALPDCSAWTPAGGDLPLAAAVARLDPARPTVGIVFYRSHRATGNTAFVTELAAAVERAGANALCAWTYSLRPDSGGRVPVLDMLGEHVDALVTTVLASGGSTAGDLEAGWRAEALENLGIPVVQAVCATVSRQRWEDSDPGLTPLDAAMQVAIPELDGRIVGVPISFKEPLKGDFEVGSEVLHYAPDPERCARVAGLAVGHARLRRLPAGDARVAIVLSSFPTKHGRIGNAVGLDTPASAVALLDALREAGYDVGGAEFSDGDALIHALIAAGGHDQDFLTDEQLAGAAARLPVSEYVEWFTRLPARLRDSVTATWGPPPGDWFVDGSDIVVAGLRFGNVFLAIQPPRGYGENPVAIYHDPALAPAHHYLAAYLWLRQRFGADAIVHLGKHGTLEWLPGKALGLSAACAPDAALAGVPFFYPFVVNDPGEGVQAKRRTHAVIVDHLVPPMMRAETYDELAELEQLLDEYARCEALDPPKLPALASRIWTVLHEAELHRDLGLDSDAAQPEAGEFGTLIEHIDGYLCEIKDLQVRDGLHVLGQPPRGEQLDGLLAALLRLGRDDEGRPGLREAIATAFGLDERALAEAAATPAASTAGVAALLERFPGPARTGGELIDRLEDAQRALLGEFATRGHAPAAAETVAERVLGRPDAGVSAVLRYAGREVVPRLQATDQELTNLIGGLRGHHVPAGPSGSPTRGRHDVLPTGRNFYSVDPRALPSELAYETGARLAEALLERHRADTGEYPESVGMVVWGTAAMRTHGDDAGEALALLGVRPVWHRETRRVTGLEAIALEELGRPRIDVTLRISGFFRDAFPSLVTLLDDAVTLVAGLDEPSERNLVRKHVLEDVARLSAEAGLPEPAARRRATLRVFGARPGAYGTGLLPLLDTGNWRDDADLAAVYEAWGGHAYGRGVDGLEARSAMREQFARIQVAVKNVDSREHDLLDSGDYFAEHGGMVAYVRHLSGASPRAAIGDSSDPSRVRARSLEEESRRVFRARVANPRWIASMIRHGYKGAFELSATVDYLFGYDATTGVVEDWMYETLAEKYVLDPDVRDFMRRSNPWALRAVSERLLEAADRGLWAEPRAGTLEALREAYLAVEDELEGAAS